MESWPTKSCFGYTFSINEYHMKTFRTTDGSEWSVVVNVLTIKRVMVATGLKLTDLFSTADKVREFFADEVRICEVLFATVQPQAEERQKSLEDFLSVVDGTVIESAMEALIAETADFFQEPRKGLIKQALAKYQEATTRLQIEDARVAEQKLQALDFDRLFSQTLTSCASSSQALAGSIHGDTHSAN